MSPANPHDPTAHIPRPEPDLSARPETRAYSQAYPADDIGAAQYGPVYDRADGQLDHSPRRRRRHFDPGVDLGRYVGSAVVTTVVAALIAYLGVLLANTIAGWVPESYWQGHALLRPESGPGQAAWLAAAGAILASGVMWLLLQITTRTGMFFTAIATLVAAIGFLTILAADPWQTTLGSAIVFAITVAVVGGITAGYARLSTSRPERY